MTVWCHLPTIFNRRYALRSAGLLALSIAFITTLFFGYVSQATPGINKTLSFQGRLLQSSGAVVADGHYNIQFKIYQDGAGTAAGNPGGSLKWTETYINNGGTAGVEVKNGYFSVTLGSLNPFGTNVDWDQDTLWLSMNVAGSSTSCTTFGTAPCTADGEMLPMKRITATPYALNAGQLGGKTAGNFVQLAQGVQTDASTNTSSIHINKTGSGDLIQLQNSGADVLTVTQAGNLSFGSATNHTVSVNPAADNTDGKFLTVQAGQGGNGSGNAGGDLRLQGGDAGGTSADGGNIHIDAGSGNGSGNDGYIDIGANHARDIIIGSTYQALNQNIYIGANNTSGSEANVTIGSGGSAAGGSTTIRAKDGITIETNGTTRATFSDNANTVYFGNGVSAAAPNDFTIQGTDSSATAVAGGSLTIQGGNATTGDANGGNITISGGAGAGNGANGLVILATPTFSTVTNDANCYTGGAIVTNSCTIAASTVNNSSAVLVGFSNSGQAATLPNPTITTAGRILYVMAASNSEDFTLRANIGGGAGIEQNITMRKNTTATMIWNGSNWTAAGASSTTTLQDAYNNAPQNTGDAELILNNSTSNDGLTIRDSSTDPVNGTLLEVQSANAAKVFSVNSNVTEYATDAGAETVGSSAAAFPDHTWGSGGAVSVSRHTTTGNNVATGKASVRVVSSAALSGAYNLLSEALAPSSTYNVSMSVRLDSGSSAFTDLGVFYAPDGITPSVVCTSDITITSSEWKKVTCSFQTPSSGIDTENLIAIGQTNASGTHTFYIDNLSVTKADSNAPNVQVGGGTSGGPATLFTLDKSAAAPTAASSDALLGSMYYDTTIGKVQCFEAEGWGACGASPDTFVTISPEYTNAVMNGTDIGTITSDLCSDTLNINDGSSSQPTICGTDETYNFYKWTSAESTNQTRSIFVTYQLPSNFKNFVAGSTSLMGRTDSTNSAVTYQIYRDGSNGLVSCGSAVSVSTGSQSTWQKATATGGADPSSCSFEAGESILFRINLTAKDNTNAFVSNLGFTFNNN